MEIQAIARIDNDMAINNHRPRTAHATTASLKSVHPYDRLIRIKLPQQAAIVPAIRSDKPVEVTGKHSPFNS